MRWLSRLKTNSLILRDERIINLVKKNDISSSSVHFAKKNDISSSSVHPHEIVVAADETAVIKDQRNSIPCPDRVTQIVDHHLTVANIMKNNRDARVYNSSCVTALRLTVNSPPISR